MIRVSISYCFLFVDSLSLIVREKPAGHKVLFHMLSFANFSLALCTCLTTTRYTLQPFIQPHKVSLCVGCIYHSST